jgi:LruC domain-containing protein
MKKIIFIIAIIALVSTSQSRAQVSLNFESGNKAIETGNCWAFGAETYSNLEFRINGFWSGRSNQLTSPLLTSCWIKTPWIKLNSGNLTMKARLENSSGTSRAIVFSYIPYDNNASSAYKEGTSAVFSTYTFPLPLSISIRDITIPIPAEIASSPNTFKILISFIGTGGTSRAFSDDISIPGTYNSNPANNCLPLVTILDQDNDGVADADDEYPTDVNRAYDSYFPSQNQSGTLAFEDLWPAQGDYDFNDVVVDYSLKTVTNAANNVVEVFGTFDLRANGAAFNNGFGFQLDGIAPDKIISATGNSIGTPTIYNFAANGLENGQTFANYIVFDDSHRVLGKSSNNTDKNEATLPPARLNVHLLLINNGVPAAGGTVSNTQLTPGTFNFFIVSEIWSGEVINENVKVTVPDRGKEIHLAGRMPTSLVNSSLFGTLDDDSNPAAGKYYKTGNNLPWGINILQGFDYPIEKAPINEAYLHFVEWAVSSGVSYPDWFSEVAGNRNQEKIY